MTVISGVLTAPDGSALPSVSINLKALATSTAVVAQLESETVTDANGDYSISAEVGQYQVTISAYGQPDKLVGNIQIFVDSVNGTLNDFLTTPGEDALTPVIVATVEQMRADAQTAAADAIAAKAQVLAVGDSVVGLGNVYKTMLLAQAAITAGTIPNNGLFSTISTDPLQTYAIWQNVNGTPTAVIDPSTGAQKTYPSGAAVDAVAESVVNITPLNDSTKFSILDYSGEYIFGPKYDDVTTDQNGNILYGTIGAKYYNYMDSNFSLISVKAIKVNGIELDVSGILPSVDKENLESLSSSTAYSSGGGEYAFNPKSWVVLDGAGNVIFDVDDYMVRSALWDIAYQKSQEITPQVTNPLAPFSDVDSSGKSQVFVYNFKTGIQTQVTSGSSNETNSRPDDLGRIVWQSDRTNPPPGGLFYAALPDLTPHAYIARKAIVGWGHSFINQGPFLNRIHALTGLPTYNFGLSGQTSDAIAARQGGVPTYYAPVGGSIPASGSVTLTPAVPGPSRSLAAPIDLKCNLAGVDGTFHWSGTAATFTRLTDGSAVNVSIAVPLYVYPITTTNVFNSIASGIQYDDHDESINIFQIGRNNITEFDTIMADARGMVKYIKNIGQKIVFLGDFNASSEPTGSAGFIQVHTLNDALANEFPDIYCQVNDIDLLQNFNNHANPNSPNDMADVAAGITPRSLRQDNLHPSLALSGGAGSGASLDPTYALEIGANVNADYTVNFFQNMGWL
ncbi:prophage tail fiber N-terminal domain-containing protein [Sodalis sp. RH16]|uniref:prophage tail fiber N-terminal domain-containing protein n=1 Tax=Sodalis sp. RH16 TaxID=3394331 RepID=UPI0039B4D47D